MTTETHTPHVEPPSEELTHTRAYYLYRDEANYKVHGEFVVEGVLTDEEKAQVRATLNGDDQFLPDQVGIPVLYTEFPSHYADDGPWHELGDLDSITSAEATGRTVLPMTAAELHQAFVNATWDLDEATEVVERWKDSTPLGR